MNQRTAVFLVLALWTAPIVGAQSSRALEYAQTLAAAFAKDGVTIQSGIGADGTQNLAVLALGGYFPLQVRAKAGIPTVLRLYTNRTYDCGRAFFLPELKKKAVLPAKGETVFALPPQKKGATLFGTCGMGMYTFEIRFE